jgi:hypothetical protein
MPLPHSRQNKRANDSHGDFNDSFSDCARNWLPMLLQTFDVPLNGVSDVHHCFVPSLSLRNTAGQGRAFSNKYAVLVGFDGNAEFHIGSLAIAGAFAMFRDTASAKEPPPHLTILTSRGTTRYGAYVYFP